MSDIEAIWRTESRRVLASLIRLLGDFDRAEEALNDAFLAAAEKWPRDGLPANPRAWLVSAGRFKTIDRLRRKTRFEQLAATMAPTEEAEEVPETESIEDDRLRLIFICCHPDLPADARIALTLRQACGLTTEEIATAFLSKPSAVAQRIVRAKNQIRDLGLAYEVPEPDALPERLDAVLHVIYLIFTEGHSASHGEGPVRADLCDEAIRLCRLLRVLCPQTDVDGLLSLMLLQHARRRARVAADGRLVLLADQDRTLWERHEIAEGLDLLREAFAVPPLSAYTIEAAIAAQHVRVADATATDWGAIVGLYDLLQRADASPVVALNRAVAVAMRDGPAAGLSLIAEIEESGALRHFRYLHAAKAELLRRSGDSAAARLVYEEALALSEQSAERQFLEDRIAALG